jgi:hypothetical protein
MKAWICVMHMQNEYVTWVCCMAVPHGDKDMKYGRAAWQCSAMQRWHATLTRSIDLQHRRAAWTSTMDMQHGHAARTSSINRQHGQLAMQRIQGVWTMDMHHGRTYRTDTWTCIMNMGM